MPQGNWAQVPHLLSLQALEPMLYNKRSSHRKQRKLMCRNEIKKKQKKVRPERKGAGVSEIYPRLEFQEDAQGL